MARTRYQRDTDSNCGGSTHANKLLSSAGAGETENVSIGATAMNSQVFRFTTDVGDIGTEDLGSGLWTIVLDVSQADSPLDYEVFFVVKDDDCVTQGTEQAADQNPQSGTGLKTFSATWDPPSGTRYQARIIASGNGAHTDPNKVMELTYDSDGTFVFPDAPGAPTATQPKQALIGVGF